MRFHVARGGSSFNVLLSVLLCFQTLAEPHQEERCVGDQHDYQAGKQALLQTKGHAGPPLAAQPVAESKTCSFVCKHPLTIDGPAGNGGVDVNKDTGLCEHYAWKGKHERSCGKGGHYQMGNFVDCTGCTRVHPPAYSLHDIVGEDGAFVLSLNRSKVRFDATAAAFGRINVSVTRFLATDFENASDADLEEACYPAIEKNKETCSRQGKAGWGCSTKRTAALALSHKRALEAASKRIENWTAIFEDDAVPLTAYPEMWGEDLRKAWKGIPEGAKFVRLGWCEHGKPGKFTYKSYDGPVAPFFVYHYPSGGCTHAYMVHKDVLPQVLKIFPCCADLDACWEFEFFDRPNPQMSDRTFGESIMVGLDINGSQYWSAENTGYHNGWFGVVAQNRKSLAPGNYGNFTPSQASHV